MNLYRLTNQFLKLSQVLEPVPSKDPRAAAMSYAGKWLDKIKKSGRSRKSSPFAEIVFAAIANGKDLNYAANQLGLPGASAQKIIDLTISDIEKHYYDLLPVNWTVIFSMYMGA